MIRTSVESVASFSFGPYLLTTHTDTHITVHGLVNYFTEYVCSLPCTFMSIFRLFVLAYGWKWYAIAFLVVEVVFCDVSFFH